MIYQTILSTLRLDSAFKCRPFVYLCSALAALHVHKAEAYPVTEFPCGAGPFSITVGSDGNLWVALRGAIRIGRITTGGGITEFALPQSYNYSPINISTGSDGNLWFTTNAHVGRITPQGSQTFVPSSINSSIWNVDDIAAGSDGRLWLSDRSLREFLGFTPSSTPSVSRYNVGVFFGSGSCIAPGPDGALWAGGFGTNSIWRSNTSGSVSGYPIPTSNAGTADICTGPDGAIWFTESNADKVGKLTTNGVFSEFSVPSGYEPYGICAGPDGAVWFTARGANKIGRTTANGSLTFFDIPTLGSDPTGIVAGPDGALWFTCYGSNKIGRIFPPSYYQAIASSYIAEASRLYSYYYSVGYPYLAAAYYFYYTSLSEYYLAQIASNPANNMYSYFNNRGLYQFYYHVGFGYSNLGYRYYYSEVALAYYYYFYLSGNEAAARNYYAYYSTLASSY